MSDKAVKVLSMSKELVARSYVSPMNLITDTTGRWTYNTYMYVLGYTFVFILCFILSINNYSVDDPTPYGHRILYAISAGLWNIIYLVYYVLFRFQ